MSTFPATAARTYGLGDVPLICAAGAVGGGRHAAVHPGAAPPDHRAHPPGAPPRLPGRGAGAPGRPPRLGSLRHDRAVRGRAAGRAAERDGAGAGVARASRTGRSCAAALADGTSRIEGALTADDTEAMADNLARLRIPVVADPEAETIEVEGTAGRLPDGQLRAGRPPVRHDEPLPAAAAGPRPRSLPARRPRAAAQPGRWAARIDALRELGAEVLEEGAPGPPPRHRGRARCSVVRSRCRATCRASSCRACCWRPRRCPAACGSP